MLDSAIHQKNHFPADKTFGDQYLFFNANCCYASISQGKLLHVCLAVRNVLPGGTSVPQWQKFHTDDVKSVLIWSGALIGQRCIMWTLIYIISMEFLLTRHRCPSWRNVPSWRQGVRRDRWFMPFPCDGVAVCLSWSSHNSLGPSCSNVRWHHHDTDKSLSSVIHRIEIYHTVDSVYWPSFWTVGTWKELFKR